MTKTKIINEIVEGLRDDIDEIVEKHDGMKTVIVSAVKHKEMREIETIRFDEGDKARHTIAAITAVMVLDWEDAIDLPNGYILQMKFRDGNTKNLYIGAEKW